MDAVFRKAQDVIDYVAGSDITAGTPVFVGAIAGIPDNDIANGEKGGLRVTGQYDIVTAGTFSAGDVVDWSGTAAVAGAGGDVLGFAVEDNNGGTTVRVNLNM